MFIIGIHLLCDVFFWWFCNIFTHNIFFLVSLLVYSLCFVRFLSHFELVISCIYVLCCDVIMVKLLYCFSLCSIH